ncbi:MAG: tetratricopeptide repeat protein [Terracidiphilus sp.]
MRIRLLFLASTLLFPLFVLSAPAQAPAIDLRLLARAKAGDAAAQVAVGACYAASAAGERRTAQAGADYEIAAGWYRKAAAEGSLDGELHLAALYRDGGKGFARDSSQAAIWYRKAAEQGDAGAAATIGLLYSIGQGVPQNYVEAYYWTSLAAALKSPNRAQYIANRQRIGTHLTLDEVNDVEDRVTQWLAAHPERNFTR